MTSYFGELNERDGSSKDNTRHDETFRRERGRRCRGLDTKGGVGWKVNRGEGHGMFHTIVFGRWGVGGVLGNEFRRKGKRNEDKGKTEGGVLRWTVCSICKDEKLSWSGEPVDVYANELRRLGRECGFIGKELERIVKLAFVTGFPDDVGVELQQMEGIKEVSLDVVLAKARILASNRGGGLLFNELAAPAVMAKAKTRVGENSKFGGKCYRCDGPHPIRDCPVGVNAAKPIVKCFRCEGPHLARNCPERKSVVCWSCGGEGHYSHQCETRRETNTKMEKPPADRKQRGCVASSERALQSKDSSGVPIINVGLNGNVVSGLVDTGCSMSMVKGCFVTSWEGESRVVAFDGRSVSCRGEGNVSLDVGGRILNVKVLVMDKLVDDIECVIGMDVIERLGGLTVRNGEVEFGNGRCSVACRPIGGDVKACEIYDKDFEAQFDGHRWVVKYFWKGGREPVLTNMVADYNRNLDEMKKEAFDEEVKR